MHRSLRPIFEKRYTCPLCARLWLLIRLLAIHKNPAAGRDADVLTEVAEKVDFSCDWADADDALFQQFSIGVEGTGSSLKYDLELRDELNPPPKKVRRHPIVTLADQSGDKSAESHHDSKKHSISPHSAAKRFVPELLGDGRLEQIQTWLGQGWPFTHKTEYCQRGLNSWRKFMPTRLVHVGSAEEQPRLVLSELLPKINRFDEDSNYHYATLSHCWGNTQITKLTTDNLEDFRASIPMGSLNKVFQEAIMLCRALEIEYIWIDSLCIIQEGDDMRDWSSQSSQMERIYTCSYLNIAASASTNGTEGLFRPYRPVIGEQIAKQLSNRQWLQEPVPLKHPLDFDFQHAPLHHRGWVLQEFALASRTLHFTDYQMAWQCKCSVFTESHPRSRLTQISWAYPMSVREAASLDHLERIWAIVVNDYSRASVTFPRDREVALRGLALEFQYRYASLTGSRLPLLSHRDDDDGDYDNGENSAASDATAAAAVVSPSYAQYSYGIWQGNAINWLMWTPRTPLTKLAERTTRRGEEKKKKPEPEIAPSWSWMSVNGKVVWHEWFVNPGVKANRHVATVAFSVQKPPPQLRSEFVEGEERVKSLDVTAPYFHMDIAPIPRELYFDSYGRSHSRKLADSCRVTVTLTASASKKRLDMTTASLDDFSSLIKIGGGGGQQQQQQPRSGTFNVWLDYIPDPGPLRYVCLYLQKLSEIEQETTAAAAVSRPSAMTITIYQGLVVDPVTQQRRGIFSLYHHNMKGSTSTSTSNREEGIPRLGGGGDLRVLGNVPKTEWSAPDVVPPVHDPIRELAEYLDGAEQNRQRHTELTIY